MELLAEQAAPIHEFLILKSRISDITGMEYLFKSKLK